LLFKPNFAIASQSFRLYKKTTLNQIEFAINAKPVQMQQEKPRGLKVVEESTSHFNKFQREERKGFELRSQKKEVVGKINYLWERFFLGAKSKQQSTTKISVRTVANPSLPYVWMILIIVFCRI